MPEISSLFRKASGAVVWALQRSKRKALLGYINFPNKAPNDDTVQAAITLLEKTNNTPDAVSLVGTVASIAAKRQFAAPATQMMEAMLKVSTTQGRLTAQERQAVEHVGFVLAAASPKKMPNYAERMIAASGRNPYITQSMKKINDSMDGADAYATKNAIYETTSSSSPQKKEPAPC